MRGVYKLALDCTEPACAGGYRKEELMLRKVVLLLLVFSVLTVAFGCSTYNASNLTPTAHLRRLTIAGEQLRIVHEDVDRVLLLEHYPIGSRYHN